MMNAKAARFLFDAKWPNMRSEAVANAQREIDELVRRAIDDGHTKVQYGCQSMQGNYISDLMTRLQVDGYLVYKDTKDTLHINF
jgi:triosephosphate isomerase